MLVVPETWVRMVRPIVLLNLICLAVTWAFPGRSDSFDHLPFYKNVYKNSSTTAATIGAVAADHRAGNNATTVSSLPLPPTTETTNLEPTPHTHGSEGSSTALKDVIHETCKFYLYLGFCYSYLTFFTHFRFQYRLLVTI